MCIGGVFLDTGRKTLVASRAAVDFGESAAFDNQGDIAVGGAQTATAIEGKIFEVLVAGESIDEVTCNVNLITATEVVVDLQHTFITVC